MDKFILALPYIVGIAFVLTGTLRAVYQKKFMLHLTGVVTATAKRYKKYSRVKVMTEAPVVRYTIRESEYTASSRAYYMADLMDFKKGSSIKIRVSRKNPEKFVPENSGKTANLLIIGCGIGIVLANTVLIAGCL